MFDAFAKAFAQLGDPAIRRIVWISLAIAAAILVGLWSGAAFLLSEAALFQTGWLDMLIDVLGGLAALVVAFLMFPAVMSGTVSLFLDQVADAVDRRHYPANPPGRNTPLSEDLTTSVRFLAVMVGLNLLIVPLLLIPPVFPFVFYAVNGYLLGREYFELVALRRIDARDLQSLRRQLRKQIFLAGLVVAVLLTIPLVNLLAPIVGTAAMVHLFEAWRRRV
jgi:uncharacterized protein involved in cysteine biosynthesis